MPREPPRRELPKRKLRVVKLSEKERPVDDLVTLRQKLIETQSWYDLLMSRMPTEIKYGYDTSEVINWAGELDYFLSVSPQIFLKRNALELAKKVTRILGYMKKGTLLKDSLGLHLDYLQKLQGKL